MIGRIAKKLKGEVGTCGGCFTTVFSDEDYVLYRGGVFCVDCALYTLKAKKKGGRSVKTDRPRSATSSRRTQREAKS